MNGYSVKYISESSPISIIPQYRLITIYLLEDKSYHKEFANYILKQDEFFIYKKLLEIFDFYPKYATELLKDSIYLMKNNENKIDLLSLSIAYDFNWTINQFEIIEIENPIEQKTKWNITSMLFVSNKIYARKAMLDNWKDFDDETKEIYINNASKYDVIWLIEQVQMLYSQL